MMSGIKEKLRQIASGSHQNETDEEREINRILLGETLLEMKRNLWNTMQFIPETWDEFGFQVFSQSNEDGLIQYLIHQIGIPNKTFIEFGVEDYSECNTKFLLLHNNWSGFIMDGSEANIESLKQRTIYWKHDIVAKSVFITKDNINELLQSRGFDEEVGILSIDIDGNDYWVWETIDCINPCIVICEYNPIFGSNLAVSIPYDPEFYRTKAHYSNLYWGASLRAYVQLGKKKGYKLVCNNKLGHNAFFVREDIECDLPEVPVDLAWRGGAKYRESRDADGNLTFLSGKEGLKLIENEMVVDMTDGHLKKIKDCC